MLIDRCVPATVGSTEHEVQRVVLHEYRVEVGVMGDVSYYQGRRSSRFMFLMAELVALMIYFFLYTGGGRRVPLAFSIDCAFSLPKGRVSTLARGGQGIATVSIDGVLFCAEGRSCVYRFSAACAVNVFVWLWTGLAPRFRRFCYAGDIGGGLTGIYQGFLPTEAGDGGRGRELTWLCDRYGGEM